MLKMGDKEVKTEPTDPYFKEEEAHATHSFKWIHPSGGKTVAITCNTAGSIKESLQRCQQFTTVDKKNENKELVIITDGSAISTHFPCCLIKNDTTLKTMYIKVANKDQHRHKAADCRNQMLHKMVTFNIATTGGKNIVNKIMRDIELKKAADKVCVYAFKGETVKEALERDGRFSDTILTKYCGLSDLTTEDDTEMSNPVDDLDGKSFKIISLGKLESQSGELDDAKMAPNEPQKSSTDVIQDPPQLSTSANESVNTHLPEEKAVLNTSMTLTKPYLHKIPDSGEVYNLLCSQFEDLVKHMKKRENVTKFSDVKSLLCEEYGKNVQACLKVAMVRKLMDRSESVCQVRANGDPKGSGFLLTDRFILTNAHVVELIGYDKKRRELSVPVTVTFSFESLETSLSEMKVKNKVVAIEYNENVSEGLQDWALLELDPVQTELDPVQTELDPVQTELDPVQTELDPVQTELDPVQTELDPVQTELDSVQTLPCGLLNYFGYVPPKGGICIIGHPGEGVKCIDPCFVIPVHDREKEAAKKQSVGIRDYMQVITEEFFSDVDRQGESGGQVLTYDSCFYHGSSGSPVFDEYCNVVAMHTGSYYYKNRGKKPSLIEYGYPLSRIIQQICFQLQKRGMLNVLEKFLSCENSQHQNNMENVKTLMKRNPEVTNQECSEPESMCID